MDDNDTIINVTEQPPTNLKIQEGDNSIISIKTQDDNITKIIKNEVITNLVIQDNPTQIIQINSGYSGGGSDTYQNLDNMPNTVAGYTSGTSFPVAKTMQEMWDGLLYPYVAPSISLSSSPNGSIQELGTSISSVKLNTNTTKKTSNSNIVKIEYYKNGSLIDTNSTPTSSGGSGSYTDVVEISNNTTYYSKVYDDSPNSVNSNSIAFTYVYPMYIGSFNNSSPIESDIKSMTKLITTKGNQSLSYTISSSRFCFAFPSSYGSLSSIKDPNGFEMISTFTMTTENFTMLDGNVVSYNIYILAAQTTQTSFVITYIF